jgi:hypothetical protein
MEPPFNHRVMKSLRDHIATNIPIYILVMVLTGLVAFYSLVFIPMNERQLNNHMDRLLANKAKTVLEKYNGYKAAIESTPLAYVINRAFLLSPGHNEIYVYPSAVNANPVYYGFDKNKLLLKIKALGKSAAEKDIVAITRTDLTYSAVDPLLRPQTKGGSKLNDEQNLWQVASGNYYFVLEPEVAFFNTDTGKDERPYLWLYVRGFMENIKETNFFDDLFLVATDTMTVEKRQVQKGLPEAGAVLDRSSLGLVRFDIPDSIRKIGTGFFYKKISGQTYVVYPKEIKLRRNLSVYLVGMIEKSKLVSKAREVPAWFVVFSSLIALLLIFLMPIIKLFSINKSERLLARDARLTVFSMILTISLVTVILAGSYLFWGLEKEKADTGLRVLVDKMDSLARCEIDFAVSALGNKKIFDLDSGRHFLSSYGVTKYNEAIRVSIKDDSVGAVIQAYGENGVNYRTDKFPIKLGSRDYVRKPKGAFENQVAADYFLQAFNSYSSGHTEVGISRLHPRDKEIVVITSRLPAFINATIPSPFNFVVTDKNGEVKFNSRWRELQIENFISECNEDVTLANHIRHDVSGDVSFTYLGSDCSGYGKPILKDWYLIVYRELATTKNMAAEVFGLCLLTLALVTLAIGLIHLCLLADRKKSSILQTRDFIYHWLNPFSATSSLWMRLTFFCLLLFAAEMIWCYFFFSTVSGLLFILVCVTLFYLVVYFSLNPTSGEPGKWFTAIKCLLFLLVVWIVGLVWVAVVDYQKTTLVVLIVLIVATGLFVSQNTKRFFEWGNQLKRYIAYRLFLLSSLLVIAIGPSILFLSNHYYYTSLSIKYHCLLDDLLKLQVHDSNDVKKLHGDDYTNHSVVVKLPLKEKADSLFYAFVQDLQPQTPSMESINLGYLPNSNGFVSLHNHDSVMMKTAGSTLLSGLPIVTGRVLENLRWVNNGPAYSILLIALCSVAGLWYMISLLPRKIFFAPDLIIWDCLQEPKSTDFLELEFENNNDPQHVLHSFSVHDRANLFAYKDSEKSKEESKEDPDAFRDRVILKLQDEAEDLYEMAWRKCSEEEKYFLYDLASDGIASQVDQVLIGKLAEKRLIRLRPYLRPVNVSFANYVLKSMTTEDIDKWKEKESSEGNWRNLKWILLIVIATVFIFLSVAEENFLGRVTAILASIGLVVPQLINIVTSVGGIFKKG